MNTIIRKIRPKEYSLLREFLYQAIYLPVGVDPPPRSVVDLPELQVYIADFGTRPGDHGLVAEVEKKVIGAAWCRIMADYRLEAGADDYITKPFNPLEVIARVKSQLRRYTALGERRRRPVCSPWAPSLWTTGPSR